MVAVLLAATMTGCAPSLRCAVVGCPPARLQHYLACIEAHPYARYKVVWRDDEQPKRYTPAGLCQRLTKETP